MLRNLRQSKLHEFVTEGLQDSFKKVRNMVIHVGELIQIGGGERGIVAHRIRLLEATNHSRRGCSRGPTGLAAVLPVFAQAMQ